MDTPKIRRLEIAVTDPDNNVGAWARDNPLVGALAAIVVSGLVVALDNTILVTALPTLAADVRASTTELQWISAAYRP